MLVRQVAFPEQYDEDLDTLRTEYSDRLYQRDPKHWDEAPFLGGQQYGFEDWIRTADRRDVIKYLKHQLGCGLKGAFKSAWDKKRFTGFRVTVGLRSDTGAPYYCFQLFNKNRESTTKVSSKK